MDSNNISGIYIIQSILQPERIYIGSAINISKEVVEKIKATKLKKKLNGN
jgi:hypothetical protein